MTALRFLVVAQALKGTLTAREVGRAIAAGVDQAGGEAVVLEGSDGGDGLLDALAPQTVRKTVHDAEDPRGRPIAVQVGWLDNRTAVIESRLVCGLGLLSDAERDPLVTTTRGLGRLIAAVDASGAQKIVIGLGGSGTVDGGMGMARAWGWVPRTRDGAELPEGGGALQALARIDTGDRPAAPLLGLCDVRNPLLGPDGAARVYGPQKGASPSGVATLEAGLTRLVEVLNGDRSGAWAAHRGAGAAGGLGFGLLAFADATLVPGAEWVLERVGFGAALARADAVVVVEGTFDRTSFAGKLTGCVIERARAPGRAVLLLAPQATDVPADVLVQRGGGIWDVADLTAQARRGARRLLALLARE